MEYRYKKISLPITAICFFSSIQIANATVFPSVNAGANQFLVIGSGDSVLHTPKGSNAVSANGSNALVTATDTTITTQGHTSNAVNALSGGVVNLDSVIINVNGVSSFGITSEYGGIVNASNVTVNTSATNSTAIHGSGGELNINSSNINTSGFKSYGIISDVTGSVTNFTDSVINTSGDQSIGINSNTGLINLTNATIETSGNLAARGISIGSGAEIVANNIRITTHGANRSDGLVSSGKFTGSNINILTEGQNSYAITMGEFGDVYISNSQISTQSSAINFTTQATHAGAFAEIENTNILANNNIIIAGNSTGKVSLNNIVATSKSNQFASAINNGSLDILAKDNTSISGSAIADSTSSLLLSLEHQSQWVGYSQNATGLSLDSSSKWVLSQNSDTKHLTNAGNIIFGDLSTSTDFYTLTAGSLSGNGKFAMRVEGQTGDFLAVTENVTGSHVIQISGSGQESSDNYHLIHAQSSQSDSFGLTNGSVDLGAYQYSLTQRGDDWFLTQESTTPSTDAVLGIASAPQFIFDGEMQNLRFRKGDLRNNKGDTGGVWGRYITNNTRVNGDQGSAYRLQQDGFEIGGDSVFTLSSGQLVLGGLTSITDNGLKQSRGGKSNITSYSLGLYSTYFSETGYYIDGVIKANRFDNQLNALMTDGQYTYSNYHQNAIGASLETGYLYQLDNAYFLEPYVRASYFIAESKDIYLDNGMQAQLDNNKSAKGEVGTSFGKLFSLANGSDITAYAKLAIEREFIKKNNVIINSDNNFNNNFSGNAGKYGIGLNSQVTKATSLFAEIDYRNGNNIESPIMANVGFRINF